MFPSSGFFKGVTCPYLTSGLCERPYCHYRHSDTAKAPVDKRAGNFPNVLPVVDNNSRTENSSVTNSSDTSQISGRQMPSMLNMMGNAISRVQTRISAENPVSYRPTPKTAVKNTPPVLAIPQNRAKDGAVEYTPTPIHLLRRSKSTVDKSTVNELQYDPVMNYSTKMLPLGNTRVTLADAEREFVKRSFEEDADRSVKRLKTGNESLDVEAKFSEDEEEEGSKLVKKGEELETKVQKDRTNKPSDESKRTCKSVADQKSTEAASALSQPRVTDGIPLLVQGSSNGLKAPDVVVVSVKSVGSPSSQDGKKPTHEKINESLDVGSKSSSRESSKNHKEQGSKSSTAENTGKSKPNRRHSSDKKDVEKSGGDAVTSSKNSDAVNKENKKLSVQEGDKTSVKHHRNQHSSRNSSKSHFKHSEEDLKKHSNNGDCDPKEPHLPKTHSSRHSKSHESSNKKRLDKEELQSDSDKVKSSRSSKEKSCPDSRKDEGESKVNTASLLHERLSSVSSNQSQKTGIHETSKNKVGVKNGERHRRSSHSSSEHGHSKSTDRESRPEKGKTEQPTAKIKTELGNGERLRKSSHSSTEHGHSKSMERESRKTEQTTVKIKTELGNGDGSHPVVEIIPSAKAEKSSRTHELPSRNKSQETHSVLGQSGKVVPKRDPSSKTVKRAFSQVDLFGEDSDMELDSSDMQSPSLVISSLNSNNRSKGLQRSSKDSADQDSNSSFEDAASALYDSPEEELNRFEECHRLFLADRSRQFRKSVSVPVITKEAKTVQNSADESASGKKRVAHGPGNDPLIRRLQPAPKKFQPSAAKALMDRYREMQKSAEINKKLPDQSSAVHSKEANSAANGCAGTLSTAALKVKPRVAHMPKSGDFLQKPILTVDGVSKIPVKVRQLCLEKIFHECVNIYDVADDAKERAVTEEKTAYEKSTTKSIYLNLISNAVKRLRDESPLDKALSPKNPKALSHEAILGGSKAANTSYTVNRWGKPPQLPKAFSDSELYKRLLVYVLSETQLVDNSFPRPSSDHRDEVVIKRSERDAQKPQSTDANQKFCCRCGKSFIILPNGNFAREEECLYHWGHAWKQRVCGTFDNIYNCCGGDLSSRGCQVSKCHVHDENKYKCLSGYMSTMPSSPRDGGNYGVYALDCEMVYTTFGCELARVTIIGANLDLVLDKIVKPDHEVIDYNTRFSGLTAEDLKNVTTTLRDIQAILLHMFNDRTILIGHSLESDLVALKLVHHTVVDTSVVFPHRRGPPFKRALQNVVKETLQKIIQNSISGHDSSEDARSCMELMLWKVKEDAKKSLRYA